MKGMNMTSVGIHRYLLYWLINGINRKAMFDCYSV